MVSAYAEWLQTWQSLNLRLLSINLTAFWPLMSKFLGDFADSVQDKVTFGVHIGFATRRAPVILTRVLELPRPAGNSRSFFLAGRRG
jgi:hypothetical protein